MERQGNAEQKERTLIELIAIGVLITMMMASFVHYYFKQESTFVDTGLRSIANQFSTQVQAVRGQWLMDGQPNIVKQKETNGDVSLVSVNQNGWPDSKNCQQLWQIVLQVPMQIMNQPISVIELQHTDNKSEKVCRYRLASGQFFDYLPLSGQIRY